MNKQIQVLYTIFELELAPPFELVDDSHDLMKFRVRNKYSTDIGLYYQEKNRFSAFLSKDESILNRIRQVFNFDEFSDDDVYLIAKHLFDWLQVKFPARVTSLEISNIDNYELIIYKKNKP